MSWQVHIKPTPVADLDAAVDAAQPSPALTTDEGKGQFAAAQAAAKDLAATFDGEFPVVVNLNGHACQESPGSHPYDSISVAVHEHKEAS